MKKIILITLMVTMIGSVASAKVTHKRPKAHTTGRSVVQHSNLPEHPPLPPSRPHFEQDDKK